MLNRLSNRLDNRLYRVYRHSTGCQTGLHNPVSQPVERTVAVRSTRLSSRLSNPFDNRLTTGWMFVYTIQPVVKPVVSCKRGISMLTGAAIVSSISTVRVGRVTAVKLRSHWIRRQATQRNAKRRTATCGAARCLACCRPKRVLISK